MRALPVCFMYGMPRCFIFLARTDRRYLRIELPWPETNAQPFVVVTPPTCESAIATVPTVLPVFGSIPMRCAAEPVR